MSQVEWKEVKLGELSLSITDGTHSTVVDNPNGKCFLLSCKNVRDGRIVVGENERRIDEETLCFLKKRTKLSKGDVLLTTVGTVGEMAVVNEENINYEFQRSVGIIKPNHEIVSSEFLYYALRSEKTQVLSRVKGAVQQCLFLGDMKEIVLKIPSFEEQKRIAGILSSLDDKIELNNKINDNLEKQAQALFKNWFIDYAPFGGVMPEDWKEGKLSDIAEYEKEKIDISELTVDTYYSTENMLPNKAGVSAAANLPSIELTTQCFPGETIISNIRPYFKKIFYCTEDVAGCSTDVLCFKPKKPSLSVYNYSLLFSDIFFEYMMKGSKGTKMPRGDKSQIMNYEVSLPTEDVLQKFDSVVSPMQQQIKNNRDETLRLITLRDTLLPKLMSGEMNVENIQI